jgi:hypothetical protein
MHDRQGYISREVEGENVDAAPGRYMGWEQDIIFVTVRCCLHCFRLSRLALYCENQEAPYDRPCHTQWRTGRFHRSTPRRERYSRRCARHHAVEDATMHILLPRDVFACCCVSRATLLHVQHRSGPGSFAHKRYGDLLPGVLPFLHVLTSHGIYS